MMNQSDDFGVVPFPSANKAGRRGTKRGTAHYRMIRLSHAPQASRDCRIKGAVVHLAAASFSLQLSAEGSYRMKQSEPLNENGSADARKEIEAENQELRDQNRRLRLAIEEAARLIWIKPTEAENTVETRLSSLPSSEPRPLH
jgi:hypothetical protein